VVFVLLNYPLALSSPGGYHSAYFWHKKITAFAAIFYLQGRDRLAGLYQSTDALCTQHLAKLAARLKHADGLQVRSEGALGSLLGPGAVATKGGLLSTMCTFSHNFTSFLSQCGQLG
jgi:hypothetical protein